MDRLTLTRLLIDQLSDELVVTNLGKNTYDLYAVRDRPENFYTWGAMGQASSIGLGLALAVAPRKVIVLDGDGSLLMNLGVLATIARQKPSNLIHIVWDNEQWAETGGQPTHTAHGTDLVRIAQGAGISQAVQARSEAEFERYVQQALAQDGPWFILAKVVERHTSPIPPVEPVLNKRRLMEVVTGSRS
ncbi:MAG: hypothetical protein D6736_21305 [Nitrospinota bacterium]|nr:MAG: hypothetical protein D6736_21305 [Nitrospinota bacterium]